MTGVEAFLNKMKEDSFRRAFEGAQTAKEKAAVLAEAGLGLSVAEAKGALGELSDEALDAVAGGDAGVIRYPPE